MDILKEVKDVLGIKFNKGEAIETIKDYGETIGTTNFLSSRYDNLRDDKDVLMEATKYSGGDLSLASDRLKNDRELVISVVKRDGLALEFASNKLKNDKEIVLEAVKENVMALKYASGEIQNFCKGRNPVKAIESAILAEELQQSLSSKPKQSPTKKLKI